MANAAKQSKKEKIDAPVKTSTARAAKGEPVGAKKEDGLRHGNHVTAASVAVVLIGGDTEKQVEKNRLEIVKSIISTSDKGELEAVLRSAKNTERVKGDDGKIDSTRPENYGPLVVELVKHGMKLGPAKVRASEFRTIASAFPDGRGIDPKAGWFNVVASARETLKESKEQQAESENHKQHRSFMLDYYDEHGDDAPPEKAREYADAKMKALMDEQAAKEDVDARNREVKRLNEKFGFEDRLAIITQVAASMGYNVTEMPKSQKAKANITEVAATEAEQPAQVH